MIFYTCILLALQFSSQAAVIGIDLGSELIKTSIIQPGKKFGMLESQHSKRMIPHLVAFSDSKRLFGEDASAYLVKDPFAGFNYTQRTGESLEFSNGRVTQDQAEAMVLEHIRKISDKQTSEKGRECVITIPSHYKQAQRKNLLALAEAARLQVYSLMHENTAAALYYGIDRFDNSTTQFILFYNLGSSQLQVTLAKYNLGTKRFSKLSSKSVENIEVLAHASSTSIGGSVFDQKILEHLLQKTQERNPKAEAKLLREANSLKKKLSASKSVLVSELDFTFEREDLEALIQPEALTEPIEKVLEKANLGLDELTQIELVGGVSRIPKVQEVIKKKYLEPQTHLNGDEAMAYGSAVYAANFTEEVRVKPIWISDKLPYPIKAKFGELRESVVFKELSNLGSFKKVSLNSDSNLEITLAAKYEETFVDFVSYQITEVELLKKKYGVTPTILVTLELDSSGIAKLSSVQAKVETEVEVTDEESEETHKKKKIYKEALTFSEKYLEEPFPLEEEEVKALKKKLDTFTKYDEELKLKAQYRNELESLVYYVREKLEGPEFLSVWKEDELQSATKALQEALDWAESETYTSERVLAKKLEIQEVVNPALEREKELLNREEVVLDAYLKLQELHKDMEYLNKTKTWVETEEKAKVSKLIEDTKAWLDQKVEEQSQTPLYETPVLKINTVTAKLKGVEKRVQDIKNTPRPKPKKEDL